jgi:hypothetical protein
MTDFLCWITLHKRPIWMLDVLRVIIHPKSVGPVCTPENAFLTGFPAAQKFFRAPLHLIISEPSTKSLVTKSPGTLRWKVPTMVMTRTLKLFLQPTAPAEFAKESMAKFWTAEQPLGTL